MSERVKDNSVSSLEKWAPGLTLLRTYKRQWFGADLWAGVTVCVVMIPSVIAYAGLMGLRPEHGLYAALVPLLVYPFFGSSRQVIVGPDIAISLLTASVIAPLASGAPERAAALAATVALLAGLLLLFGARVRLGGVADFLSKPVLVGYMSGAALILIASQLSGLFRITLNNNDFFPRIVELAGKVGHTHQPTLFLGLGLLAFIALLRGLSRKVPAVLVICVVATAVSALLHLDQNGFEVVGQIPAGLPKPALPALGWQEIHSLLPAAIGIALLTYTEGILLARAFASKRGYEVNPNAELGALGLADVLTGFFQGFSITGSQARTTINDSTGGKTQVTSLVAAAALIVFLMFLTPLIALLPKVALSATLIYGGVTLIELGVLRRLYRFYPASAALAGLTCLGVLAVGVVPGILIGVALSLLGLINRISNPPDAILHEVPGSGFHDLGDAHAGFTVPGLIAYRFYAPLLFSNASYFVSRVRHLVATSAGPVRWFLLDAQAITAIDVTAAEALRNLCMELRKRGVAFKIAHANPPLRAVLARIGFERELGAESFFASVHESVEAFQREGH
jgi:sulfate permease, SulP family